MAAGDAVGCAKAWRRTQAKVPGNAETLRLAVRALAAVSPGTLVEEITEHVESHRDALGTAKSAAIVLDATAHAKCPELMDQLHAAFVDRFAVAPTSVMYEALLAGHALAGNEDRVA